jgi:phage-related protein
MLTYPQSSWTVAYFSKRVRREIHELPPDILADYLRLLREVEIFGTDLRMPHSKALGNKLFELRPSGKEGEGRVFYCTQKGKQIVMLHSFVKKTQRTPVKELSIARQRLKEIQHD